MHEVSTPRPYIVTITPTEFNLTPFFVLTSNLRSHSTRDTWPQRRSPKRFEIWTIHPPLWSGPSFLCYWTPLGSELSISWTVDTFNPWSPRCIFCSPTWTSIRTECKCQFVSVLFPMPGVFKQYCQIVLCIPTIHTQMNEDFKHIKMWHNISKRL